MVVDQDLSLSHSTSVAPPRLGRVRDRRIDQDPT
jgi:hypothetical protein